VKSRREGAGGRLAQAEQRADLDTRLTALENALTSPDECDSLETLITDLARVAMDEAEAATRRAIFEAQADGQAQVETPEGITPVGPGMMIFIPAEQKHRLRSLTPLFYFEFQAPNRFVTTILDGTPDDLRWERVDGRVWVQT
jgi:hypothetical protein